jgi:hypothetical protein
VCRHGWAIWTVTCASQRCLSRFIDDAMGSGQRLPHHEPRIQYDFGIIHDNTYLQHKVYRRRLYRLSKLGLEMCWPVVQRQLRESHVRGQ